MRLDEELARLAATWVGLILFMGGLLRLMFDRAYLDAVVAVSLGFGLCMFYPHPPRRWVPVVQWLLWAIATSGAAVALSRW